MGRYRRYAVEFLLVGVTMAVGALGFWDLYFGAKVDPQPHHHLHVATTYSWMLLLLVQLVMLARGKHSSHRKLGLAVLVAGPVLVASTALLTVHSANRALASGEPDTLIVQNVIGTICLALVIFLAFALKQRRQVHGALLGSSLILFLGPALFFALIAYAPPFRIEGPETFYRFGTAAMTGQGIVLVSAFALFLRDRRNNWPYLLAGGSFLLAEGIKAALTRVGSIDPLTRVVGSPGELATFIVTLVIMAGLLAITALPGRRATARRKSVADASQAESSVRAPA